MNKLNKWIKFNYTNLTHSKLLQLTYNGKYLSKCLNTSHTK